MKQPVVTPFTEKRARRFFGFTIMYTNQNLYKLSEDYQVKLITGKSIVIPKGFVSDGATIPWIIRFIFSQMGVYFAACVVHDFLYDSRMLQSRLLTDIQFLYHMTQCGMNKAKAELFYTAVRIGGKRWWNM